MNTAINPNTAAARYEAIQIEIKQQIEELQRLLAEHDKASKAARNWTHYGSLTKVSADLNESIEFLR